MGRRLDEAIQEGYCGSPRLETKERLEMGVRVLYDATEHHAALYDSVSMTAFGPLFGGSEGHCLDADDEAYAFLRWFDQTDGRDTRTLSDAELEEKFAAWRRLLETWPDTSVDWQDLADTLAG